MPYDSVGTSHLLANHERDADDGPSAISRNLPHLLEDGLGRSITSQATLSLELFCHVLNLLAHVLGISWHTAKLGENKTGPLPVVLTRAPTGRFGGEEHAGNKESI